MRQRSVLFLAAALCTTAFAASLPEAQSALDQGKWQDAASAGASLNTSAGLALAAKSNTLGASIAPEAQRQGLLQKANGYADQAIKLDGNNADAYFEKARATGRLVQYNNNVLSSLGSAKDMKRMLDKTLSLQPKMAGAYVALGLWNAELAAKGGAATLFTGASGNNVVPNFEKAVALEPEVPTHRLEYANALLKLSSRNKNAAITQLQKAVSLMPHTFWEKQDVETAQKLLSSLK